jgi:hypothetical protein
MDALSRSRATTKHATASWSKRILVQLAWLAAAAAFVTILLLTYGLDLSAGFF